MKNRLAKGNIFYVLFYRILIVMILFSLSRAGFYAFNQKMFPDVTFSQLLNIFRGGLLFDLSAVVYINLLVILLHIVPFDFRYNRHYQAVVKYIFLILNSIAIAINSADYIYYRFVFKRATADVFGTFEHESNLVKLFFKFQIDYWPVVLFTIFLFFLLLVLYNQVNPVKPAVKNKWLYHSVNVLMIPLIAGLAVVGARGGYRHSTRPISISNAARFVENPHDVAIVLNTPFSLIRTFNKKTLTRYEFFDEETLKKIYNPHYVPSPKGPFKNENIVILILESFAREYIGALNPDLDGGTYKGYTPFVDSLLTHSLTFDVTIANGKKSIEAMPSVLASIPSLETPYTISHYANNTIKGLPSHLKDKGYYSAFFHGAPNGSMGFDSFARMAGFDDYFGLDQYPNKDDFDGVWGVWDEPFFQFFAEKLNSFPQPFLASIFSVSSHHPFKVPEKYKDKFPEGPAPITKVVSYTDFALREFFSKISTEPWYNNTLFIITADHTNESIHKEFQNDFGSYSVPIIFFKPGSDMKGMRQRIAQQIDIMPTVLNYLNYDKEFIAFGNDLFDDTSGSFAFNTTGSKYNLYMDDHIMEMMETEPVGVFNYKTDKFLVNNLLGKNPELQNKMEEKLRAIIQTYNSRLLDNRMTVEGE
ncbi:MAG: sulfatase-like hydrolase/transferase [Bacteroidales bacterium]|nr:sulfatase-like hydrolase/transferase [Bacteroidales bacterium]